MKTLLTTIAAGLFSFTLSAQCNDIFISEIVEGSGNNHAIELYNPTSEVIDLSIYGLQRSPNAVLQLGSITYLSGIIAPHSTYVVAVDKRNPNGSGLEQPISAELELLADTFINPTYDQGQWAMYFNGNDPLMLYKNGSIIDHYGGLSGVTGFGGWSQYGIDSFGSAMYASTNHTQVRKSNITGGNGNIGIGDFDVLAEYDTLGIDDFSHLGWHISSCYGCNISVACNYNPLDVASNSCTFPGCTNSLACNFNPSAGCDDGSCHFTNTSCNDNNSNTILDSYNASCNCIGIPYTYGTIASSSNTICPEISNTTVAINSLLTGMVNYSIQWYFKTGNNTAPSGSNTSGWNIIPGATASTLTVDAFTGTRTYACFVTPDASYGISGSWMSGAKVLTYSSFAAQTIIGNPNITPFNAYNYIVNPIPGHTYNWSVTNGAIASGQGTSNVSIMWGQNGPYQLTLTEGDGTCSGSSYLFAVNNNCSISVSAASSTTNTFCAGTTLQLQAATSATGITYQWYLNGTLIPNETNQNISVSAGGNYQVSINQNGCTAISNIVSINQLPSAIIPSILVEQANAGCAGGEATLTVSGGTYTNLLWNNGLTASSINVNASGDFSITAIDENGCAVSAGPVSVNFSILDPVPVCIVTVDQVTGKNNVVWEPVTSDLINSYVVLKETNVANEYAQIGTVAYGSSGIFEDVNSDPQVQANRYKLALIDTCGILSSASNFHKTIHLTANQGIGNNVNLIWSDYEGFDFGSYSIYRGASPSTLNLVNTIASNLNSYTDVNPPAGETYYMIEVAGVSCDPQRTLVYSHSNILDSTVGIEEFTSTRISLYPNPASTSITLQVNLPLIGEEYVVFDAVGKVVYKDRIQSTNELIQLENFNNGNYFFKVNEVVQRFVAVEI